MRQCMIETFHGAYRSPRTFKLGIYVAGATSGYQQLKCRKGTISLPMPAFLMRSARYLHRFSPHITIL